MDVEITFEFAKNKGAEINLHANSPTFKAVILKGFTENFQQILLLSGFA